VLGKNVLLVTAASPTYPERERREAQQIARELGIKHELITSEETDIPAFIDNPPDRCYFCKKELFEKLCALAKERGIKAVFDGSNVDDECHDYRPGRRALKELHVVSPLLEAGLDKSDIRELSRALGLPTADKPAYACLASRFPYGEKILKEKLQMVERAEEALRDMGFSQLRVRYHGDCARIELTGEEIEKGWREREAITAACKKAGFTYVSIDTQGYRMGAMNESLAENSP
jgi:uncharacterized protein